MSTVIEIIAGLLLVGGAFWVLAAAIGIVRFPTDMARLHSASKPQIIGLFMLLTSVGLIIGDWGYVPGLMVVWVFQLLTVPISAHIVARTAHRTANRRFPDLVRDDLLEDLRKQRAQSQHRD